VGSIVVTRLDGLGDAVLSTALLEGLHQRWPAAQVRLVVRPGLAGVADVLPEWVRVTPLTFDPYESYFGREEQIVRQLRASSEALRADLFILGEYNRVWASEMLAMLSKPGRVLAFEGTTGLNATNLPLREMLELVMHSNEHWKLVRAEYEWREPLKYHAMLAALGVATPGAFVPKLCMREADRAEAARRWSDWGADARETILLFPGSGEGLRRSLTPATWAGWATRLAQRHPSVALLGSGTDASTFDAIASAGLPASVRRFELPALRTGVLAAVLESARAYIGADTGPMHVAAAVGTPTLGVFGGGTMGSFEGGRDPARFLPVGPRAAAIRMPLGCYGCHWRCAFDERLCLTRIPLDGLIAAGDAFLQQFPVGAAPSDPLRARTFDLAAPAEVPTVILGPVMRQHHAFLELNHKLIEHHDYLARVLGEMTRHNENRDRAIGHINGVLTEMTRQNEVRDLAISNLGGGTDLRKGRRRAGRGLAGRVVRVLNTAWRGLFPRHQQD
jgi:ADP-heptose:LPS heptosyltransferase